MNSSKTIVQVLVTVALFFVASSSAFAIECKTDSNCDGKVDLSDLVTVKAEFLNTDCDPCMCNPIYACPAGMVNCGGTCVDPMKDRDYCGAMPGCIGGSVCGDGEICEGGECILNCPSNLTNCNGTCVDTATDERNCGACDYLCLSSESCVVGNCLNKCTTSYPSLVPRTGQITSYLAGDDGDLQAGLAWPEPRFTDNLDGTVTDNLTGLIWLQDANCFGLRNWGDAAADCNSLSSGSCGLTDNSQAGDWRLPSVNELISLINYEQKAPIWLSANSFINVEGLPYWTSTRFASTGDAHVALMDWGGIYDNGLMVENRVWPVKGISDGPAQVPRTAPGSGGSEKGVVWPDPRFTDNLDGTITDNLTGLIWLREPIHSNCIDRSSWVTAISSTRLLADGLCGLTDRSQPGDWRVANFREIMSLADYSRPSGYGAFFPVDNLFIGLEEIPHVFTSTTHAYRSDWAWRIYTLIGSGRPTGIPKPTVPGNHYWPVRSGIQ